MHTHWTHQPRHMGHLHRAPLMIDHPPPEMAMCGFLSPPGLNSSAMHQIFHLPVSKSLPFLGICTPLGFPDGTSGKEPACQCRRHKRLGFHLRVWKIPWRRAWQPLQNSCLENPMDRGAWWATVHGVAKSRTRLSDFTFTFTLVVGKGFS